MSYPFYERDNTDWRPLPKKRVRQPKLSALDEANNARFIAEVKKNAADPFRAALRAPMEMSGSLSGQRAATNRQSASRRYSQLNREQVALANLDRKLTP